MTEKWNGEGLPPVGEWVTGTSEGGVDFKCLIVGVHANQLGRVVVFEYEDGDLEAATPGNSYKFRPLKSEADRKRDEAVAALTKTLSISRNYLTPKCSFVFKRIEELEQGTMRMSYNDGPAKGIIRDLYRVVDNDDGSKELAEMIHDAGYRKVNVLTDDQITDIADSLPGKVSHQFRSGVLYGLSSARSQIMGDDA